MDYLKNKLTLSIRKNISFYYQEKIFSDSLFYKISNLDVKIHNTHQFFSEDIKDFSNNFSNFIFNSTESIIEIFFLYKKLSEKIGLGGPIIYLFWNLFSSMILKYREIKNEALDESISSN